MQLHHASLHIQSCRNVLLTPAGRWRLTYVCEFRMGWRVVSVTPKGQHVQSRAATMAERRSCSNICTHESTNTHTHTGTQRRTQRQTATDTTQTHRQHTHSLGRTHAWIWGRCLLALPLLTCTLQRQTGSPGGSPAQPLSQSRCLKPGRTLPPQTPSLLAADQAGCAAL